VAKLKSRGGGGGHDEPGSDPGQVSTAASRTLHPRRLTSDRSPFVKCGNGLLGGSLNLCVMGDNGSGLDPSANCGETPETRYGQAS
jgi:hypothetical protein